MILIFSTSRDPSTLDVIRWISHLSNAKVVRINSDETYSVDLTFSEDDFRVRVDEDVFRLAEVSSVWLRKGDFWFRGLFPPVVAPGSSVLTSHLSQKLQREDRSLRDHFHYVLQKRCAVLGSANGSSPNKLVVLERARELGLRTPPFSVSTSRQHAQDLLESDGTYVAKAMSDGLYLFDTSESKAGYFTYTEALEPHGLDGVAERMAPSFFQRYVEKKFELRIFFVDRTFRAVAIFSQADDQTRIDYRKYNMEKPNRVVPFRLPEEIEHKLSLLNEQLGLNTGSIDMIVDKEGQFYFLEVNPAGQFGALSESCNQSIERLIAERLLAYEQ
jgi:ATP-GRASP peptide maturase of grasp-with-spasm system